MAQGLAAWLARDSGLPPTARGHPPVARAKSNGTWAKVTRRRRALPTDVGGPIGLPRVCHGEVSHLAPTRERGNDPPTGLLRSPAHTQSMASGHCARGTGLAQVAGPGRGALRLRHVAT